MKVKEDSWHYRVFKYHAAPSSLEPTVFKYLLVVALSPLSLLFIGLMYAIAYPIVWVTLKFGLDGHHRKTTRYPRRIQLIPTKKPAPPETK